MCRLLQQVNVNREIHHSSASYFNKNARVLKSEFLAHVVNNQLDVSQCEQLIFWGLWDSALSSLTTFHGVRHRRGTDEESFFGMDMHWLAQVSPKTCICAGPPSSSWAYF